MTDTTGKGSTVLVDIQTAVGTINSWVASGSLDEGLEHSLRFAMGFVASRTVAARALLGDGGGAYDWPSFLEEGEHGEQRFPVMSADR